ncbi:CD44 antigen isoform X2 [Bufo gargarizans]|uniref:CD44 antigen isoform X2 n=1 Tax=Bufo gargarizans TaxID=30331 RepID=UPI001CF5E827|nr:CD44 antigen isoform X2 [Bufo gargarizans]
MAKPLWIFCFGLLFWISISQSQIIISCRFQGVFHVEKVARYSLGFEEAKKTCSELDAIIATKEQVETAHEIGFETCRYGWVENGSVVIPRITSNIICAAGYIGVYVLHSNATTPYDVYCYNTSETSEKNCEQYDYHNKSLPSYDPTEEEDGKPLEDDEEGNIEITPEPDSTEYDPKSPLGGPTEGSSDSSKNKHRRKAAVPEWLIVCVSLVCLGLVFSVCIAINARRLCGQKKKLVINGNKASPEDGVIMEHNGDTVKSQEMVQLVSRDQTGDGDGLSQDNMRNAKDANMKIGV